MLIVNEIFISLQGESTRMGLPCVFVRLAGCNLHCTWCDTTYASSADAGHTMSVEEVVQAVERFDCRRVEVTGGEPLLQPLTLLLLKTLCDAGYETLLETNGSCEVGSVDSRVRKIVDVKCPGSGEADSLCCENLEHLTRTDEVKFVIGSRADFEYALTTTREYGLLEQADCVHFSPVGGQIDPADLAEWILEANIDVRLSLQQHKILWPTDPRGR